MERPKTIFCDIDGTLWEHVGGIVPDQATVKEQKLLPNTRDAIDKWDRLGYRIILNSNIVIKDYLTNKVILNQSFSYSATYNVQDQYSETKKLENKSTGDLINKIYQNLIIKMSENMLKQ